MSACTVPETAAGDRFPGADERDTGGLIVLAYNYPLLDVFWSMLEIFLFFIWLYLLFIVFVDIFRSHDMGGFAKALWVIFVIILPYLGVLVYLIARGGKMHERAAAAAQAQQKAFDGYVQQAAGGSSTADQLSKLAELKDKGTITEAEFASEKAKILG
jgi:ABC-type multidrug transport system fused ATPase/permease subunit